MPAPPAPLAQAMILCDAIHRDRATGKFFLLGTFSVIHARRTPFKLDQLSLYAVLTECRGRTPFTVRLVRTDPKEGDQPVAEAQGHIDSEGPLHIHELVLEFRSVTFDRPGVYRFQLLSDGAPLLEKRLLVERGEDQPGTPGSSGS